ncbi:DUF6691 family protein [Oxalobacteraceae bacterium A2-2]
MAIIIAFIAGGIFGLGLSISGMVNPGKVLGFLDLAGRWDPSLALVMGGAVAVGLLAFSIARPRGKTLLGGALALPAARGIDRPLVIGAILFGVGWGIAGLCPGPALAGLGLGLPKVAVFVTAMLAGMGLFEWLKR